MASSPITLLQIDGETMETVRDFIFLSSKITADGDCSHEIKRRLLLGRKVKTNLDSVLKSREEKKKQRGYFANKCLCGQSYGFSSSHGWIWELDYLRKLITEELMLFNCGVGEDSWESFGLQPVHPKGDQSWIFIGRTDDEPESPILWSPDVKNWLIGKDADAGKDWRWEEKGMTEDKMVGWHHHLNGPEF